MPKGTFFFLSFYLALYFRIVFCSIFAAVIILKYTTMAKTKTVEQIDDEQKIKDRFAKDLKDRITRLCRKHGMSFSELATKMGLGSDTALHVNLKKGNLRLVTLQKIADAFGKDENKKNLVEVADLLTDRKDDSRPVFHCPHCGKEVTITLGASIGNEGGDK